MGSLKQQMMKRVAVIAIRFCPRHQESLQGAADRRQGDPRLLLAFAPRRCRGLLRSSLFQGQETIGQQHQAGMVVKPTPRAALKMIQPQFFLHLLVALFHRPAAFPEPHRLDPTGAHRQIREGILDLAVGPFLDQQPDWLGPNTAAPCPILARPDANPGELRRQLSLGPLAPTHLVTRQAFGQRFQAHGSRIVLGQTGPPLATASSQLPLGPVPARLLGEVHHLRSYSRDVEQPTLLQSIPESKIAGRSAAAIAIGLHVVRLIAAG